MKLTRQQKGYAAVLLAAVLAFAVDRTLLQPDDAAVDAAEDAGSLLIKPEGGVKAPGLTGRVQYRVDLLAERIAATAAADPRLDLGRVRDAFVPSAAWVAAPRVVDSGAAKVAAFKEKYKLTAVLLGERGGAAMINGKQVKVGQQVGGFRLAAVGTRSASLTQGELKVDLTLDPEAVGRTE